MGKYILGIGGLKNSGKGTFINYFYNTFNTKPGLNIVKLSLSEPLKKCISGLFGYPLELLEGDTMESRIFREKKDEYWTKKLGIEWTPRIAMQKIGTDLIRNNVNKDFFIHSIQKKIESIENGIILVDGIRFVNEIELLKKYNPSARFLKVERNQCSIDDHSSETHLDDNLFDFIISNNGTKKEYYKKIYEMFKTLVE